MEQYDKCGYTSLDNCESGSLEDSNITVVNEYCCDYILGTSSSNLSQQELFDIITIVRNLNIASLVSDYFFVILAVSVFIHVICNKSESDKFSKAAIPVLILSVLGSFIDICITFAIVGVIDQNKLINTLFELYDSECYSSDITLTLLDIKGQFETILILDSVEGVLDIVSLCVLFGGHLWQNEIFRSMAAGIHGFMFAVFDLALITVNVFIFVLPSYNTFVVSYNNNNYLCFEQKPTISPTMEPTFQPTASPTFSPTLAPTDIPSMSPTDSRLYSISMTVSNTSYHGVRDLFFRLCHDDINECTNWYAAIDGIDVVSDTYSLGWTTWDIDTIYFVDIATIGVEPLCLEQIIVDAISSSPLNNTICISTNTPNYGCDEMHIDLENNIYSTKSFVPCIFDEIVNHPSLTTSNIYLTTFAVSNSAGSGSFAPLYFIICNIDNICTYPFEIADGMKEEGKEYQFVIENEFNLRSLYDVHTVDIWTYSEQRCCLSKLSVKANGFIIGSETSTLCIQSVLDDGSACSRVKVNIDTNVWQKYDDTNCQWNSRKSNAISLTEGTLSPTPTPTVQPTGSSDGSQHSWPSHLLIYFLFVFCSFKS